MIVVAQQTSQLDFHFITPGLAAEVIALISCPCNSLLVDVAESAEPEGNSIK